MNMCVCMLMFPSPYMCMHAGPSVSSASPSHPRTSIHPHLVSERELSVLMTKAHLIIRSIQLKIGHDLLMQVISYYVLLYTSTLLYMHTCTVHVHENIREAQLPRLQTAPRPIQTLTSHSMRSRTCFCAGATRNTLSALLCQLSHLQLSDLLYVSHVVNVTVCVITAVPLPSRPHRCSTNSLLWPPLPARPVTSATGTTSSSPPQE